MEFMSRLKMHSSEPGEAQTEEEEGDLSDRNGLERGLVFWAEQEVDCYVYSLWSRL